MTILIFKKAKIYLLKQDISTTIREIYLGAWRNFYCLRSHLELFPIFFYYSQFKSKVQEFNKNYDFILNF